MNNLFNGQDCFLARRNWQKLLVELSSAASLDVADPVHRQAVCMFDVYMQHLARVPSILRHGYALRQARLYGLGMDMSDAAFHRRRAERLRNDFVAWFDRYHELLAPTGEVPSQDPQGSIFETVLHFPNKWFASITLGYWASMLIIQETLTRTGYHVDYTESNKKLTRNIFRSMESVGSGYMGPYRVGYALRVAYEFADTPTQVWAHTLLARFESHYAATSSMDYPEPGSTEYQYNP
jgi:hypothetical protein